MFPFIIQGTFFFPFLNHFFDLTFQRFKSKILIHFNNLIISFYTSFRFINEKKNFK